MKKCWSLLVLVLLVLSFTGFIYAAGQGTVGGSATCKISTQPEITNLESVKTFVEEFSTGKNAAGGTNLFTWNCWKENFINVLIYFLVPILFLFVLLYGVFSEIEIFSKKIQIVLSLLLAIMAIPTGVLSGLIVLMANLGGGLTIVFFFVIVFVLGLSTWYRRKAEDFEFFMGNKFLTILIVHSPLLVVFTLLGIWLGGMSVGGGYLFSFVLGSQIFITLLIIAAIGFGLTAIVLPLLGTLGGSDSRLSSFKKNWKGVVGTTLVAIFVMWGVLWATWGSEVAQSSVIGGFIGFLIGMCYALLQWGRVYASGLQSIDDELFAEVDSLADKMKTLESRKDNLIKQLDRAQGSQADVITREINTINDQIETINRQIKSRGRKAMGAFGKLVYSHKR